MYSYLIFSQGHNLTVAVSQTLQSILVLLIFFFYHHRLVTTLSYPREVGQFSSRMLLLLLEPLKITCPHKPSSALFCNAE